MSDAVTIPPYVRGPDHEPAAAPPLASSAPASATPDGRKDDATKLRFDLLPPLAEEAVVEVLTYGAAKYAPDNWRKVPEPQARYFAAARRHLAAWKKGERLDAESGQPHLAHAICCMFFLLELEAGSQPPRI